MKRASNYITQAAADSLDEAVDRVFAVLGPGVQKHVILLALVEAAAASASPGRGRPGSGTGQELADKLARLQGGNG